METPWPCFGGLGADVGAPGDLLEALGEHFGALGVASGLSGSAPGTVFETILGPFWDDLGASSARAVEASI